MHSFLKFIFGIKLYMFRTVPKLLMMDGGIVRNMYNFIPKINLRN